MLKEKIKIKLMSEVINPILQHNHVVSTADLGVIASEIIEMAQLDICSKRTNLSRIIEMLADRRNLQRITQVQIGKRLGKDYNWTQRLESNHSLGKRLKDLEDYALALGYEVDVRLIRKEL